MKTQAARREPLGRPDCAFGKPQVYEPILHPQRCGGPIGYRRLAWSLAGWVALLAIAWVVSNWFASEADGQTWQCPPRSQYPPGQCSPAPSRGWRPSIRPAIPRCDLPVNPTAPRRAIVINPAIVRVGSQHGNATDYGSGTIIERRGKLAYVLTCWHTLRDGWPNARVFVVVRGRRYEARVHRVDKVWDVAVLGITDPGVEPLPLADTTPTQGQQIWIAGFGSGQYRHVAGQLTGLASPTNSTPLELIEISAVARLGDSGGPFLGPRGRIVGVISATNGRVTYGTCLSRLRRILRAALPPYPNRPGVIVPKPVVVAPVRPEVLVMPSPAVSSIPDGALELTKRIAALEAKLETLVALIESREPIPGPAGQPGLSGPRGPPGPASSIDALTPAQLAALAAALPPIHVKVQVDGQALDGPQYNQEVYLGGVLPLNLISVPRESQ